jgi:hypothetical protein
MKPFGSLDGLTEKEIIALKSWEDFYLSKYKIVATLINDK